MPRTRACLLTALLACGAAAADTDPERIRVEREMQQLLQDIARLQRELQSSRTEHAAEQQRLRALDLAIQDVNLEYRSLAEQKSVHQAELARLETQRDEYLASIDQRLAQLAEQVRSAYRVGAPSRTRLLLNQDDPSRIGRMLAYYDYVNRAQVERVAGLREALALGGVLGRGEQRRDLPGEAREDRTDHQQVVIPGPLGTGGQALVAL